MSPVFYQINGGTFVLRSPPLPPPPPPSSATPPPGYQIEFLKQSTPPAVEESSSGNRISPSILVIIVVLAVVVFISGLLHLLVRCLTKHRSSSSISGSSRYPELSGSDAYQRQLQQLFHLHDSGLDQAFIDALPVFLYKEITGLKEPFDCAVCLCEFTELDKLRLLPSCNHAFHLDCIDTWLMSNSTCPLCRGTLYSPGLVTENPVFDSQDPAGSGGIRQTAVQKTPENHITVGRRVFSVRLGKFKSSDPNGEVDRKGESSNSNLDGRRCYSMGSCQYVVADSALQVVLCPNRGESSRSLKDRATQLGDSSTQEDGEGKKLKGGRKGDSFSVSKVWLWSNRGKPPNSSESQLGTSAFVAGLPLTNRAQLTLR